jgi:hypothetical protein
MHEVPLPPIGHRCPRPRATTLRGTGVGVAKGWRVLCALTMLAGVPAHGQAVSGSADDAIPLPRGTTRITVGGVWNDHADRFVRAAQGPLRRAPYLAPLSTDQAGAGLFPQLAGAEAALRALTGNSALAISLGALEATGDVRQSIAPITIERGITRRLGLRLVLPYVESRDNAQLILNRAGTGATVGLNPAFGTGGAAARAQNGALLRAVDSARSQLSAEITRCQGAAATGCDPIRTNPAGAQATLQRAQAVAAALRTVYGTASQGGAPAVPVRGSALDAAVTNALATLRADLSAFGIAALAAGLAPAAATTVLGPGGIAAIAADSSWRLPYGRFGNTRRAGIGDIDLWATWSLVDSDRADVRRRLLGSQRAVRSLLAAGWRFGTAGADRTEDALDVPIGEGANAFLLRSSTDVVFNRWTWVGATLRATMPLTDRVAVLLPARDVAQLFTPFRTGVATRRLGMRLEGDLLPRVALGEYFGVTAGYLFRHWGADRYAERPDSMGLAGGIPPASWRTPGRALHLAAAGVTFSTLAPALHGSSRLVLEVSYLHQRPFAAGGDAPVPAVVTDRLELRVYTGFPRR